MTGDDAFMAAIIASPFDDAPRLIFSDYLEENGREDQADWIRVQCRIATFTGINRSDDPEFDKLVLRERSLRRRTLAWGESLAPMLPDGWKTPQHGAGVCHWSRGFVSHVNLPIEGFATCIRKLFTTCPIEYVSLYEDPGKPRYTAPRLIATWSLLEYESRKKWMQIGMARKGAPPRETPLEDVLAWSEIPRHFRQSPHHQYQ